MPTETNEETGKQHGEEESIFSFSLVNLTGVTTACVDWSPGHHILHHLHHCLEAN